MKIKTLTATIGVILTFFLLGLVGLGAQVGTPERGGVLRIGMTLEIINLDPHVATAFSSFRVMEHIYEGLLCFDEDMGLKPSLATAWTISPDGTEYIFKLREGVRFHDGSAMTAEDVKYSLERILNPETASPQAGRLGVIKEITILNPLELKITLTKPFAPFLTILAMPPGIGIVPKNFEAKVDPITETLGTGPFRLVKLGADFAKLERNVDYWGKDAQGNSLPYLDGLLIKVIPDPATLRAALKVGDVDLILGMDAIAAEILKGAPGVEVLVVPQLAYSLLGIQNARPPFDDIRVRQALSLAVDRQEIVDVVYAGFATVGGPVPSSLIAWNPLPPEELLHYTRDIERAKQLLAEAGHPDGISFNIMPLPGWPETLAIALVIQEQLRPAGITVEIESVDFATFLSRWRAHDFDTFVSLNSGVVDPDIHLYRHLASTGGINVFNFYDPVTDKLLRAGRIVTDLPTRRDIYSALQRRIAEQVPFLFLAYADLFAARRIEVEGFVLLPDRSTTFLRQTWLDR